MKRTLVATLLAVAMLLAMAVPGMATTQIDYPIENGHKLTIWAPFNGTAAKKITSYNENESFMYAQQATGISLEFVHPAIGQETEAFNLMIASEDVTDMVTVWNPMYPGGDVAAVEDGVFIDLTDKLEQYSPAFYDILQENEEYWREISPPDGRILSYTGYKNSTAEIEGSYYRMQVRADWLEESGLGTLYTIADYENFFQWILDNKEGVIPLAMDTDGIDNPLLVAFGLTESNYNQIDGKLFSSRYDEGLKDYVATLHNWYEKGYISKDFVSADKQNLFETGKAAMFAYTSVDTYTRCAALNMPVANLPYMRQEEGQQIHGWYVITPNNTVYTSISTGCEYPEEAMMFINYGYTEEGANVYNFGWPEKAWVYDENGQPAYTDYILHNPEYSNVNDETHVLKLHSGGIARMRYSDAVTIPDNTLDPGCLTYRLNWMDDPNYDTDTAILALTYTVEDNDRHATLWNDIKTYSDEMILKFITGAEPIENFDNYMETLRGMGIEECLQISQNTYDAYMSKTR